MAEALHKKQQITAALTELRIQVQNEVAHLRRTHHPWEWASCGTILGWLLSRIPARKKRIYIHSSSQKPLISRADRPLGKLWREVWKISKPLIAAYVAKLVGEQATEKKGL